MNLPRLISLCSGIGALELGLSYVEDFQTMIYVEKDPVARSVLYKGMGRGLHFAPVVSDIETLSIPQADIVCAGFPCQPFSTASRGRVRQKSLWPLVEQVILRSGATTVFCENVQRAPIETAAADLCRHGFHAAFGNLSAESLGAPHRRTRWWLVAHHDDAKQPAQSFDEKVARLREAPGFGWWEEDYRGVLGVDVRAAGTMDRLKLIGNSAVPFQAAAAWVLLNRELATARLGTSRQRPTRRLP